MRIKPINCYLLAVAVLSAGCETVPMGPEPVLPEPSSIAPGIYSGTLNITGMHTFDGRPTPESLSTPFSIVINGDGRFLDANGIPFKVFGTYHATLLGFEFTNTCQSITAVGNQILIRFALNVHAEIDGETGDFTGQQTDTLTYDPATGDLHFVRSQIYGGDTSEGHVVNYTYQGDGLLRRG